VTTGVLYYTRSFPSGGLLRLRRLSRDKHSNLFWHCNDGIRVLGYAGACPCGALLKCFVSKKALD
jgi:hypothetical protein